MAGDKVGMSMGTLLAELRAKRSRLADALREMDRDIASVEAALGVAAKYGLAGVDTAVHAPPRVVQADPVPAPTGRATPPQLPAPPAREEGPVLTERTRRAVAALSERYEDRPRKVDAKRNPVEHAEVPKGEGLVALKESVAPVAAKAAEMPPGPGGRSRYSSKGLINGDPISPDLRNILRAANGPMTSTECAAALLKKRGLDYRDDRFKAVVNRVSSRLADLARRGTVRRIKTDDGRVLAWEAIAWAVEPTTHDDVVPVHEMDEDGRRLARRGRGYAIPRPSEAHVESDGR